jgi:DNA polymerase-4
VEWLFLDLNSYFASVEQQERPELRGRPIGIVPLITEHTCCIAASYEAKAYGVKTGVSVEEAKQRCPHIQLVEARPKLYVEYHHRIVDAVNSCVPVTSVMSVDEMACRLMGRERALPNATTIAVDIKQSLRTVGATLRCSVGLAPNRYLSKIASDLQAGWADGFFSPRSAASSLLPEAVGLGGRRPRHGEANPRQRDHHG